MFGSEVHAPGALILGQGAPCDRFFILASAKAEGGITGPSGGRRSVDLMGPGDFFGEAVLLSGEASSVNVETLTVASLLSLTSDEFAAIADMPGVRELLAESATERATHLREASAEVMLATDGERLIPSTFVDYEEFPANTSSRRSRPTCG